MNTLSRRHFGLCAALAVAAAALPARAQSPAAGEKKSKVIFQVSDNDPAKWGLALNNANNVQTALGADAVEDGLRACIYHLNIYFGVFSFKGFLGFRE